MVEQGLPGSLVIADMIREMYREGQTDYGLEPIVLVDSSGQPVGRVDDGDAVIFCCRRGEREVQLTDAFTDPGFIHFPRRPFHQLEFVLLTLYHDKFKDLPVAFAPFKVRKTLGEVVSQAGLRQLRIAESEKFAHVTFFLNGGNNFSYPGEEAICVPSPKGIAYDQVPELSLPEVAEQLVQAFGAGYDLVVANFANGDVIGHTANQEAKIRCAEAVDMNLGKVIQAALAADYLVLVTADHGNLEEMCNADGSPHVAHTDNQVPLIVIDPRPGLQLSARDGSLADIAPTILSMLGLAQPAEMSGKTLLPGQDWGGRRQVLLIILDGWGLGKQDHTNPIHVAQTPVWDGLMSRQAFSKLDASGEAVGLKAGKPGNSEAGHMNIGAGRVVLQDDVRLDQAMQDGTFTGNEVIHQAIMRVKSRHSKLHLIGLLSQASSHGTLDYPLGILRMAKAAGLQDVYLHMILDGRSTAPGSAPHLLEWLQVQIDAIGLGKVVTGVGRGIALDRDGNYSKTRDAYEALVYGVGRQCMTEGIYEGIQPGRINPDV